MEAKPHAETGASGIQMTKGRSAGRKLRPESDDIIATRHLRDVGSKRIVVVRLGKPRQVATQEWACKFDISGLGQRVAETVHAYDAFQSLFLSLEAIRHALDRSGFELMWEAGEPGATGFLRLIPDYFGVEFTKHLERMVDREIENFTPTAQKAFRRKLAKRRSVKRTVS